MRLSINKGSYVNSLLLSDFALSVGSLEEKISVSMVK